MTQLVFITSYYGGTPAFNHNRINDTGFDLFTKTIIKQSK